MQLECGKVVEVGFLVPDIHAAAAVFAATMGAGPFFHYPDLEMKNVRYLGKPASINIDVALGASGGLIIELIKQTNITPSPFHPIFEDGAPVLNHWSVFSKHFDTDCANHIQAGRAEVFSAEIGSEDGSSVARLAYFDTRAELGAYTEVMDANPDILLQSYNAIIAASRAWDGRDLFHDS